MRGDKVCTLEDRLRKEKNPKVRDRLRMIILLKEEYKQKEVAKIMRVTERTIYTWKKRYEKEGIEGLKTREKPGRKRRLSDKDTEILKGMLKQRDYWTTRDARNLIKVEFGIEYTIRHVARILRKLGMRYQKPYVNDFRRPKDAEEILKKD